MRAEITEEEWELVTKFRSHALSNEERTILAHFRGNLHDGARCKACIAERYHLDEGIKAGRTAVLAEIGATKAAGVTPRNEEEK